MRDLKKMLTTQFHELHSAEQLFVLINLF